MNFKILSQEDNFLSFLFVVGWPNQLVVHLRFQPPRSIFTSLIHHSLNDFNNVFVILKSILHLLRTLAIKILRHRMFGYNRVK